MIRWYRVKSFVWRELLIWWASGTSCLSGAALLAGSAYFFFTYLASFQERMRQYNAGFLGEVNRPSLRGMVIEPYFETIGFLLVFLVPLLASRLFLSDRQNGFLEYLFSLPVRMSEFVLGKFAAGIFNLLGALLLVSVPAFVLLASSNMSALPVIFGFTSLFLVSSFYLAMGMALSMYVKQVTPLVISHFSILMVLYFLPAISNDAAFGLGEFIKLMSPVPYSRLIIEGFVSVSVIGFFVAGVVSCLLMNILLLAAERYLQGSRAVQFEGQGGIDA